MGESVGSLVGKSVGGSDGRGLGTSVGNLVGTSVGGSDGRGLGTSVGIFVGTCVGSDVGTCDIVGHNDGRSVGTGVGTVEGLGTAGVYHLPPAYTVAGFVLASKRLARPLPPRSTDM